MSQSQEEIDHIQNENPVTFAELGLMKELCDACERLQFKSPTPIQRASIPPALKGNDVIGLAQTGSGKTAAFVLPILQALWNEPQPFFACILAPTRELVHQISQQIEALGSAIGVRTAIIIGGVDMMAQAIALSKKPHVLVATPGRLQDHLENTKGFHLKNLKYLVLDEADRLLDMDFGPKIESILTVLPDQRKTFLFSATMTDKVIKLQRASMKQKPVKVEVSSKYATVQTLLQYYLFFPLKFKETYLVHLMNEFPGQSTLIFTSTVMTTQKISFMLKHLGFSAISIHGHLTQANRLSSLAKFKAGQRSILVATDVVARGLDIPSVDLVINYDVPDNSKTYIHRVGRTARAGRSGKSITFVTQYDVELYQRIETLIGKKLELYPVEKEEVMVFHERTQEAIRVATNEVREMEKAKKQIKKGNHDNKKRKFGTTKNNSEQEGELLSDRLGKSKAKYARFNKK